MPSAINSCCAKLISLCCAVCFLAVSRFDRQYRCNLRGKRNMKTTKRGQSNESKKTTTRIDTGTWYLILRVFFHSRVTGACPVTTDLIMRVNVRTTTASRDSWYCMLERNHSAARHSTAQHRRAWHGTARWCAALLSCSWAELRAGSAFFVIQQCSAYKPSTAQFALSLTCVVRNLPAPARF